MRRDIAEGRQLEDMLEKELAHIYGVSRDTARKARIAVLSEYVENSNSDKSSTNDK
jgi:DNA-binding GntR family transcriptional regulator